MLFDYFCIKIVQYSLVNHKTQHPSGFGDDENTHNLTAINKSTKLMIPYVVAAPELVHLNLLHSPLFLVLVSTCVTGAPSEILNPSTRGDPFTLRYSTRITQTRYHLRAQTEHLTSTERREAAVAEALEK